MVYQLDITAFPGNSGSPVLSRKTGEVFGVLNKVFVSSGKESVLENPSGISYAVPVRHIRNLANRNNISLD
jgi:S1-C subfamily serine protease